MPAPRQLAALAALIALPACASGPASPSAPTVADPLPACAAYAGEPDVYGFCVRRQAALIRDAEDARALCATLPTAADKACRTAWVEERIHSPNVPARATLLAMCADAPDCAFNLIEALPSGTVFDKLDECQNYTGPYVNDCVGHMLQRWVMARPDEAEVPRVTEAAAAFPEQLGAFIALLRTCQGKVLDGVPGAAAAEAVGCPSNPVAQRRCIELMVQYRAEPPMCNYPHSDVIPPPPRGDPPPSAPPGGSPLPLPPSPPG